MIAWDLAERLAHAVAGEQATTALPGDLGELARQAETAVTGYAGLAPLAPLPPPEAVGRGAWATTNLALLRHTIAPVTPALEEQMGRMPGAVRGVAGSAVGAEIGGLVGWMARRVLGQYEVALTPGEPAPPRLLLVAPNLREAAVKLDAPLDQLLAWVMVHEITHAVQFSSVPWLRPYLGDLVARLLASADVRLDPGAGLPGGGVGLDDLRAMVSRVRSGGLVTAVAGPERLALLDSVQSAMALIEGHAEHVMDAAAGPLVPDLARLREGLDRRRTERSPLAALIERLLGLDLKLRQYREGKAFCDAVVERAGVAGLNRAWVSPDHLPAPAELADPGAWLRRTRPRELPAA